VVNRGTAIKAVAWHQFAHQRACAGSLPAAREESSSIIVERHASGSDFRLLIVGDKLVAAAQRQPAK